VPLLIRVPGLKGRRVETTVNLVDIMPTMLGLVRTNDPRRPRHGRNLWPLMLAPRDTGPGISRSELINPGAGLQTRTVVEGTKKLIWAVEKNVYEMYDLAADPLEKDNLIGRDDALEGRLRGVLQKLEARIDSTHGPRAESRPEDDFRRKIAFLVDDMASPIAAKAVESARTFFNKEAFDYMGVPTTEAAYQLPPGEFGRIATRLEERWAAATDKAQKIRLLKFVCDLGQPESLPFLRARLLDAGNQTLVVALALARLGDPTGKPLLVDALKAPSSPDHQEIACALVFLGDPAGLPWLEPTLTGLRWPFVGRALDAATKVKSERVGFVLRDLVTERLWTPKPVLYKLALSLGPLAADANCRRLLLRLAADGDPVVRERAVESMKRAQIPATELEAERESIDLELDGDSMIVNGNFPTAYERYRKAIETAKTFDPGIRFRLARYLHLEGALGGKAPLIDEARAVLEDVKAKAPSALDRTLAERRLAAIGVDGAPPRITDAQEFACTVDAVSFPAPGVVRANLSFPVTLKITNRGKTAWQGGYWKHAPYLLVQWRKPDGKLAAFGPGAPTPWRRYLPPEGVAPGETVDVFMIGMPPQAPDKAPLEVVPEILWSQTGLDQLLGEKGVLWRAPATYSFGG
jgi:hypothetical protein